MYLIKTNIAYLLRVKALKLSTLKYLQFVEKMWKLRYFYCLIIRICDCPVKLMIFMIGISASRITLRSEYFFIGRLTFVCLLIIISF